MNSKSSHFQAAIAGISRQYPLMPIARQRSTPDRYGFSSLISKQLNYRRIPRSFANWVHGWLWWSPTNLDEFGFHSDPLYYTKIVSNQSQLDMLLDLGVQNVFAAGLPYAYQLSALHQGEYGPCKSGNTIVFVPDHSSESNKVELNILQYLDFIDSVAHGFDHVSVLLYSLDYAALAPIVAQRGYFPLLGADPKCLNSFPRIKAIFDFHEYVSTNIVGSHVLYALASGCRVSISGPQQIRTHEPYLEDIRSGLCTHNYLDRLFHYMSRDYLQGLWLSSFLVDHPLMAPIISATISAKVDEELGMPHLQSMSKIADLLGWPIDRQLYGYMYGATRRISRFASLTN